MSQLLPCPFCGGEPVFQGDAADWHDDSRYVQLKLVCCVTMSEAIGWRRAREMTVPQRDDELRAALTKRWNARSIPSEDAVAHDPFDVKSRTPYEMGFADGRAKALEQS